MKILVLNGVNLDLLGQREPRIYGYHSLDDIKSLLKSSFNDIDFSFIQTNSESEFIESITPFYDGIIINPAAWTHTSVAILDRLLAVGIPYIEVHLSNIFSREEFRHTSFISSKALGVISGLGINSYLYAAQSLKEFLIDSKK